VSICHLVREKVAVVPQVRTYLEEAHRHTGRTRNALVERMGALGSDLMMEADNPTEDAWEHLGSG